LSIHPGFVNLKREIEEVLKGKKNELANFTDELLRKDFPDATDTMHLKVLRRMFTEIEVTENFINRVARADEHAKEIHEQIEVTESKIKKLEE